MNDLADVRRALRDVPDFPRPGIMFKDITPVLSDARLLRTVVEQMAEPWRDAGITHVAAIESRGFILGTPVALALQAGFLPVRKAGKLPWQTRSLRYDLEYGSGELEMHADACGPTARVLVVDDVLATGGTASAAGTLLTQLGASLEGFSFLLRITALQGIDRLKGHRVESLIDA